MNRALRLAAVRMTAAWLAAPLVACGMSCWAAAADPPAMGPAEELFQTINRGGLVFVGTLLDVQVGPVGLSEPPLRTFRLGFQQAEAPLRGQLPKTLLFSYSVRSAQEPGFRTGGKHLVIATVPAQGGPVVVRFEPLSDDLLKLAQRATSLPLGWKLKDDQPVSPWSVRGPMWWKQPPPQPQTPRCAVSGRPALLAGKEIRLTVEQVPPEQLKQYQNPFGDGQFRVTVTNTTDAAVEVPALVQQQGQILWPESLVILQPGKEFLLPTAGLSPPTEPVTLAPGQSVSGIIDTLLLSGVSWPRGGSRVYFTFALGELAADNFFYYFSNLHDGMRAARTRRPAGS